VIGYNRHGETMSKRKYETPEDMQTALDAYFKRCDGHTKVALVKGIGVEVDDPEPYTMSGICIALGFSRETWREYHAGDRGEGFIEVTDFARARVEHDMEVRLYRGIGAYVGLIFGLKHNFDWHDKSETEITGANGGPLIVHFDKRAEGL
jgi:hypothetical protein